MPKSAIITTQAEEPMTLNRGVPEESAAQVRLAIVVVEVPIAEIRVEGRRRELRAGQVQRLAESIAAIGLQTPLTLYAIRAPEEGLARKIYRLVAGAHRLEACRGLGWTAVPAILTEAAELERELWEIDENLCRAELSELEKSEHYLARKDIYEVLHPETRAGGDRGNQHAGGKIRQNAELAFCHDTAGKTGDAERTIQHAIRRAKKILPEVRDTIRSIDAVADSGVELDALAKLTADEQRQIARDLTSDPGMSVRELILARTPVSKLKRGANKQAADPNRPKAAPRAETAADGTPRSGVSMVAPAGKTHQRGERRRLEHFDRAYGLILGACMGAPDLDVPDLSDDQMSRIVPELRLAARSIRKFRLKIEALAEKPRKKRA